MTRASERPRGIHTAHSSSVRGHITAHEVEQACRASYSLDQVSDMDEVGRGDGAGRAIPCSSGAPAVLPGIGDKARPMSRVVTGTRIHGNPVHSEAGRRWCVEAGRVPPGPRLRDAVADVRVRKGRREMQYACLTGSCEEGRRQRITRIHCKESAEKWSDLGRNRIHPTRSPNLS